MDITVGTWPAVLCCAALSRWMQAGHNSTAQLFLRHLRQSKEEELVVRDLPRTGLDWRQFVDNNFKNNAPTAVAITQGRYVVCM